MSAMLRRFIAATFILALMSGVSLAQPRPVDRAQATDFTVQLFFERSGELSPDIFSLEEFGVFNFSAQWKGTDAGKFSGFLVRVKLESLTKKEIFAQGRQAQFILRERKTKKVLRTWNISDVYIGDNGVSYRAQFFTELDCTLMEATLVSGATRITRELAFQCGE
jgi:hypothetical protein